MSNKKTLPNKQNTLKIRRVGDFVIIPAEWWQKIEKTLQIFEESGKRSGNILKTIK